MPAIHSVSGGTVAPWDSNVWRKDARRRAMESARVPSRSKRRARGGVGRMREK
jgi:hypothetical protein